MKKLALAIIALAVLVAPDAGATVIQFEATLTGAAEAPPNASPGTGMATVIYNSVAHTLSVEATFSDLLAGVTAAHIHCCTATPGAGTVGVATPTPTFPGFPSGVTSGSYSMTFDLTMAASWNLAFINANGGTPASAEAVFAAGLEAGRAYFNIHSQMFPGGEIRGFLQQVPEPGTMALFALALGALAAQRRKSPPTITRSTFCR